MVFHPEGQFQQFPHCKFRENIVRLLYIPSIVIHHRAQKSSSHIFLAVNKFGKVGLYHPDKFSLVYTYCLDLSIPVLATSKSTSRNNPPITPKCEKTHLVTDAVYSPDTFCVIFSTTKGLLQWYDIGEIQKQDIGLSLFPRKEFLSLSDSSTPVTSIPNNGHIECHRLFGLRFIPTCLEYHGRKLIIGDVDGGVTLIGIPNPKYPLGQRKIRGKLHKIHLSDPLVQSVVQYYKAHHHPITDIHIIPERSLILTCSKDKKFSVYVKDMSDTPVESIIVSIPKGVNSITYSLELKMVATGSDDYVVRLFNQFVMKMPQMEMLGHRSPVVAVKFVQVDFFVVGAEQGENPVLLLSYSTDSELRAWDPLTFICLQSLYLSFPIGSTIMCKTPEFATKSLLVLPSNKLVHGSEPSSNSKQKDGSSANTKFKRKQPSSLSSSTCSAKTEYSSGMIILLYCNSYARIPIEEEGSTRWPGVNYDKFIQEFEELSMEYDKKLKEKLKGDGQMTIKPSVHIQHYHSPQQYQVPQVVIHHEDIAEKDEDDQDAEESAMTRRENSSSNDIQKLNKDETLQMEQRVEAYLKEIMELRQTIKEAAGGGYSLKDFHPPSSSEGNTGRLSESTVEDGGREYNDKGGFASYVVGSGCVGEDPLTISINATDKYFEFRRAKQSQFKGLPKGLQRMISYGHTFNQYPLYELEPVQFSRRNLAIPETMKKELGIPRVNSMQDLMTSEAQKFFGIEILGHQRGGHKSNFGKNPVTGGSFSYNFNHGPQRKKPKNKENTRGEHGYFGSPTKRATSTEPSRFTVVGQKIRNACEDEILQTQPEEYGEG